MTFHCEKIATDVYAIDGWMDHERETLSCYLFDGVEPVLIDVGPSNSRDFLIRALDSLGIDVATFALTHIHIDHAGAAGHLAESFPDARVAVHERGARHLVDPIKLWRSAARIYGEAELSVRWGTIRPVAADRIDPLREGSRIEIGAGRALEVYDTPGHANHHVTFFEPRTGALLVGDSMGVCYPHGHFVHPNSPPPEFDPARALEQMARMRTLEPAFVGFAHFGPAPDVDQAFEEAASRIEWWMDLMAGFAALDDRSAAIELRKATLAEYRSLGHQESAVSLYDRKTHWEMQVSGMRRYLSRQT